MTATRSIRIAAGSSTAANSTSDNNTIPLRPRLLIALLAALLAVAALLAGLASAPSSSRAQGTTPRAEMKSGTQEDSEPAALPEPATSPLEPKAPAATPASPTTQPGGGSSQSLEEIIVRVQPNTEVEGESFTLGEVAEFDGFDVSAAQNLARVVLGRAPNPGRALALNEPLIRSRLGSVIGAERLKIIVPAGAQVLRSGQNVKGGEIEQRVLAQSEKEAGADPANLKQEILGAVPDLTLPQGQVDWQITQLGRHLVPGGDRIYQVIAQVEGKEAWRGTVRVRQKVYQSVVVATRPIRRGQTVSAEDVTLMRRTAKGSAEAGFVSDLRQAVGMKAKRPFAQDEPLTAGQLDAPSAVSEGGRVLVVYETQALIMQVPGVAMVQGKVGQFIPVRNLQSGKIVYGVVQADETVKVN